MSRHDGPRPSVMNSRPRSQARAHRRAGHPLDAGLPVRLAFYATVRTLRISNRTYGFHLRRVHSSRHNAAS
jgi:hypothetical protein